MRAFTALKNILLLCCLALPAVSGAASSTINTHYTYAWAENGGWSNFKATGGNVTVYDDHLEGYAWNESVGWIKLGSHSGGTYSYTNSTAGDWGVNLGGGSLTGYGWSENGGWIKFNPTGGGVTINSATGAFDGYAWSESIGWIHFKGSAYNVRQMLNQTITFTTVPDLLTGGSGTIAATATSGLTPLFSSATPAVCTVATSSGETANSSPSGLSWRAVASSSNARILLAADASGYLYTSTDAGASWTARMTDAPRNWYVAASSADGQRLAAAVYGGSLYTSTDAGVNWIEQTAAGSKAWSSLVSSVNGLKLAAVSSGGNIITSTDGGVTWSTRAGTTWGWTVLSSSADGTKLVATVQGGTQSIYYSHDSGATWTASTSAGTGSCGGVASSQDGTRLITSKVGGQLYISSDSGVTWNIVAAVPSASSWYSVASSADGSRLAAAEYGGKLYTSNDSGATWAVSGAVAAWESVAMSPDGSRLAASVDGGAIHTYSDSTTVTALTTGTCTINANQSGDLLYNAAPEASQDITVIPASATLTVTRGGAGSVTASGCTLGWNGATGTCAVGNTTTSITLTATPGESSIFSGWSGGGGSAASCSGTGGCTFTLSQDSAVTAAFSTAYSVTPTAKTGGSISPSSAVKVLPNAATSFTIKPDSGYRVAIPVGGSCGGTYTGSISDSVNGIVYTTNAVTANCTVAATFIPGASATRYNVTIGSGASTGGAWSGASPVVWSPSGSGSTVSVSDIQGYLNTGTNVIIATNFGAGTEDGDIIVSAPLPWNSSKLTLEAAHDIGINAVMTPSGSSTLTMNSAVTVSGGAVKTSFTTGGGFAGRVDFDRSGAGLFFINGAGYTVINSLGTAASSNDGTLQGMQGNLSGKYALGGDIDAADTSNWNSGAGFAPVGDYTTQFTGGFNGLGHTITGLTVNRSSTDYVGLFGYASGAAIANVGLVGGSVTGNNSAGALTGWQSGGSTANCYATGSVTGSSYVGGLVGHNYFAAITTSYTTGSVAGSSSVGGLAGYSREAAITSTFATGSVTGSSYAGGLVGMTEQDNIGASYATGNVTGGSSGGGLAGINYGSSITSSYASGSVTGSTIGGLVGANEGSVANSFWDADNTGLSAGYGSNTGTWDGSNAAVYSSTGSTAFQSASYTGFDISASGGSSTTWRIYEGQSHPLLRAFLTPLTVTANSDTEAYNGATSFGGNGVTYDPASYDASKLPGALTYTAGNANAGSTTLTPGGLYSSQQGYDISYINGTLTISKATASVSLSNLNQSYDGTSKSATVTTTPGGLTVGVTYNGSTTVPVSAGIYAVVATISDTNYQGTASDTLTIGKSTATVTLNNLNQSYDGTAKSATVTTTPGGLTAGVTYNGSTTVPINAGIYTVFATVNDSNYQGSASGTLVIAKASQIITFASAPSITVGGTGAVGASASSGLAVTLTSATPAICSISGTTVTGATSGTCVIVADQAGDANYDTATQATQNIAIGKATATVTLGSLSATYDGTAKLATATTNPVGLAVTFTYNGNATAPINTGNYAVVGTINDTNYSGSATGTLVIGNGSQSIGVITFTPTTLNVNSTTTASATATSGLAVTFTSGTPTVCTVSGATVTGVSTGTCTITAFQSGNANYSAAPLVSQNLTVADNSAAPILTVSTLADASVSNNATLNVSGTATGINGITSVTVNGTAVTLALGGGFSQALVLQPGTNTVTTVATDNGGTTTTDSRIITLDTTAPVVTISSPPDNTIVSQPYVTVTGSVADGTTTVTWSINGSAPQTASLTDTTYTFTANLGAGMNTIQIMAVNVAGAKTQIKRTVSYQTPFSLSVTDPATDIRTVRNGYLLTGAVSDNSTPVTITIGMDGQTFTPTLTNGVFQQKLTFGSDKVYQIGVTGIDQNSNSLTMQRNIIRAAGLSFTIVDALLALQMTVGIITPDSSQTQRLDVAPMVNGVSVGDGKIDIEDTIVILRMAVGLIR